MPIPTIPIWAFRNKKITNFHNAWTAAKERYNSMSDEEKAEASRVTNEWARNKVLPGVVMLGEMVPQTSLAMSAYAGSEALKKGNYVNALQHMSMPAFSGIAKSGTRTMSDIAKRSTNSTRKLVHNADNYLTIKNAFRTGKLRFGEPIVYTGIHQSETPFTKVQFPFQRWDVTTHGADPNGFWLTLADSPNTTGTMASRPYASKWSATSQKPLIQTGEVKGLLGKKNNTRNAIVQYGKKHGADAFEFRGIRDNAIPQTNVVMVTEGTNPQYLGGVGQVRYAGPTTGKSTFIKANSQSNFVDLDAIPGYKQIRKDIAEQLGLDWKSPKVTDSPEYQQAFNNFIRDWAQNTENTGKTLFGSAKGLLRGDNPLTGQPFIPDFETFVARNQARGFKENPEQLRAWYNSIIDSYPEIKIDNRFVSEIETPQPTTRLYRVAGTSGKFTPSPYGAAEFAERPIAKTIFRANVYKGGEIADPYNSFFTTDPEYAAQYGPVKQYIIEGKNPSVAKEPLMGYRDPATMDMFVYRNIDNPESTIIIGKDAVTKDIPYQSKGIEVLSYGKNNIKPVQKPKEITLDKAINIFDSKLKYLEEFTKSK